MRENFGWSFRERSFAFAVALSFLWHFFWFFSISITVSPARRFSKRPRPQIVSLGPVLDDTLFKTLVQNKPQFSQTFYRRLSDFSSIEEVEVKTIERHAPGEVVSVPFGKRVGGLVRNLVGGDKATAPYEFLSRLKIRYRSQETESEEERKKRLLGRTERLEREE